MCISTKIELVPQLTLSKQRQAAEGMRNRAAERAMNYGCVPNDTSEAIENLPLPKPLWTETVRPQ